MNVVHDKSAVHWIEVMVATVVLGVVLVIVAVSVRTSLTRERDAMRLAAVAATRAALEQYGASKGIYPNASSPVFLSGGCIDADAGVVAPAESATCSAPLFGVPNESKKYGVYYQSTPDGTGYALISRQEHVEGGLLCATPFGISLRADCTPSGRTGTQ